MTSKKAYQTTAPLPFVGQKRRFIKHYVNLLNECIEGEGEGWTIVDCFGGSGLLSHVAKRLKPKARVIYNDFEGYTERLKNVEDINRLRVELLNLCKEHEKAKIIKGELRERIIETINNFNGFIDIHSLSTWLLFSGQQVKTLEELYSKSFYNNTRTTEYANPVDYLNGLEITKKDYKELLPEFKDDPKALFVLDPPYLCTNQGSYEQDKYFGLVEFLKLIEVTRPPFLFFSSTRSEIIQFLECFNTNLSWESGKTLKDTKVIKMNTSVNYAGKYEDNLIYKF